VRPPEGATRSARAWLDGLAATLPPPLPAGAGTPGREWAQAIDRPGLPNLHRVSEGYYRSAQPTAEGIGELGKLGIRTVINLRSMHSDRELLEHSGIRYVEIPCHAWHAEEEDVVRFLKVVSDPAQGPFLVHCAHGADRTGLMTAVYRIACQEWSKDEAIDEMTHGGFGFNPIWTGLVKYVRDLDVEKLKREAA